MWIYGGWNGTETGSWSTLVFPLSVSFHQFSILIIFIFYRCCTLFAIDTAMKCNTMKRIMALTKIFGVSMVFSVTCWDTSWKAYTSISASFFLYCYSTFWSCVTSAVVIQKTLSTVVTIDPEFIDSWFFVCLFCFYWRWLLHLTRIICALLLLKNCSKPLEAGFLHSQYKVLGPGSCVVLLLNQEYWRDGQGTRPFERRDLFKNSSI